MNLKSRSLSRSRGSNPAMLAATLIPLALGLLGFGLCMDALSSELYLNLNEVSDDVRAAVDDAVQYANQPQASKNALALLYARLAGKGLPADLDIEFRLAAARLYSQAKENEKPMPAEAIRVYEEALRAYPNLERDPRILLAKANLGNLYLINNRDVARAKDMFESVLNVSEEEFLLQYGYECKTIIDRRVAALHEAQSVAAQNIISHRLSAKSGEPADRLKELEILRTEWPLQQLFQREGGIGNYVTPNVSNPKPSEEG